MNGFTLTNFETNGCTTFTEDELMLIRQALCVSSTRYLMKGFDTEDELKRLGRAGERNYDMEIHSQMMEMIARIDKVRG